MNFQSIVQSIIVEWAPGVITGIDRRRKPVEVNKTDGQFVGLVFCDDTLYYNTHIFFENQPSLGQVFGNNSITKKIQVKKHKTLDETFKYILWLSVLLNSDCSIRLIFVCIQLYNNT